MASLSIDEPERAFRFLDVDEEPQKILPPIEGYENTPFVAFDKAIVPLGSVVPDVQHMVRAIKIKCRELAEDLTRDESMSIKLYSIEWRPKERSLSCILNKTLRSENRQYLHPWLLFLRLILTALSHLPASRLTVYRGFNMDLTGKYPSGTTVVWWGFSSCIKNSNLLEKRLFSNRTDKRTLFIINCYSGREIHRHSHDKGENEILLPPARQFGVVCSGYKGKNLYVIELNEIQPAFDFSHAFSIPLDTTINHLTPNINFHSISTASLSKKSLPAAILNRELEERCTYFFKQHANANLTDMKLTDSDMDIIISEIICKRQCSKLNLSSNNITYSGTLLLSHTLLANKTLTILDFSSNQIGDKGAEKLAEALRINTTLTTLNLNTNQIGEKGAQQLCEALKKNTTLVTMNIGDNQFGDKGAQYLGEALQINKTLSTLIVWSNQIGDKGAHCLADALRTNTTLAILHLTYNRITDLGMYRLEEAMRINTTLTMLDLRYNQIERDTKSLLILRDTGIKYS